MQTFDMKEFKERFEKGKIAKEKRDEEKRLQLLLQKEIEQQKKKDRAISIAEIIGAGLLVKADKGENEFTYIVKADLDVETLEIIRAYFPHLHLQFNRTPSDDYDFRFTTRVHIKW